MGHLKTIFGLFFSLMILASPALRHDKQAPPTPEDNSDLHGIAENKMAPNFES